MCVILCKTAPSDSLMGMLERYELAQLLGRGAAGDVFVARDKLLGGREVALKRISARMDDALRRAFEREFATMASLSLPGVAQVFDFGTVPDAGPAGETFYTRAYIAGSPLDRAALSLPPIDRLRLFCKVAEVIATLHRAGVVHGDIKPGNAIVDERGDAHVIDFGLARLIGAEKRGDEGGGTLPFMAPELVLDAATPSVKADVFALGVTLWYLLTGSLPFGPRGALAPEDSSRLVVPEFCDETSRRALDVAQRACAADPLDRLPTVAEFIAALHKAIPTLQQSAARRLFAPPRPRGQAELIDRLQALCWGQPQARSARALLVSGLAGAGKSLLLRELKWRVQIRGLPVLDVSAGFGAGISPLVSLARHLELALGGDAAGAAAAARALAALQAGRIDEKQVSDALADAFGALSRRSPLLVLVDDLDRAESLCGVILRSAIFAESAGDVLVVATATHAEAPAVARFAPSERLVLAPLSPADVDALAGDALGVVDASVLEALREYCQGLPSALMDALAALWELPAPTVADVTKLPPAGASLLLATTRLARTPPHAEPLLHALAVLGNAQSERDVTLALTALGMPHANVLDSIARCEHAGLVERRPEGIRLKDVTIEKALLRALGAQGQGDVARRVLDCELAAALPLPTRAHLSVVASDSQRMRELVPAAGEQLAHSGAHAAAAALYEALLSSVDASADASSTLALARCRQALGELERAASLAHGVLQRPDNPKELRVRAAIVSAQASTALGRFDEAVATLSLVPGDSEPDARATVQVELARVHLRRGDYDAVQLAADAGLACVRDDVLRSQLLCSAGMAASYRAQHDVARERLQEAVALARRGGSRREEANALATLAIGHFRSGDLARARDLFSQCLEIARGLGDVGSMANFALNVGVVMFCVGEPAAAAEHYESAGRLARRAGRQSTDAQARCNLAHVHIYFGLYERAKVEVSAVLDYARGARQKYIEAQATALHGDLAAREGDVERALIHYDDAIGRYADLGQCREVAEHHLDAAEVLLDRGGPADASAAAARLAAAREPIERDALPDLSLRLSLLLSRARLLSSDAEGALKSALEVLERARTARNRDAEWSALETAAQAQAQLGAEFASRRYARMAMEVLEEIALRIPWEHREAFWHDPRRRAARDRALTLEESSHGASGLAPSGDVATLMGDVRAERLLDIIKRLAAEQDLDRLLSRITESAVDLSGAERGYVLLVDDKGQLEQRISEVAKSAQPDPHAAFSRSIAEAVLIDGEAIVTVDATRDGRLSEYISVHKLMLRSVACMPIRGRSGTVGVLYLEHRRSRGRFSEASVALLNAFADQAAIALENARLNAENQRRQRELEAANQALEQAKRDLEEMLSAKTEALLEAQRELMHARRSAKQKAVRHGMVGRSAAMQRVFDTIDRIHSAKVPVIVQGESGTGKELVARAIHDAGSRAKSPFVAINCGALSETLLESELFGHVEGAFSGAERKKSGMIARASGGTLFLDEVGAMPAKMQVDLLRVLQEGTVCKVGGEQEERVDVRVIAASNRRLEDLVREGKFREDLYYRLNVVEITLPPLRERREDIALLCEHFLSNFADRDNQPGKRMTREAMERMLQHPLPGNVRQLEHVLLQAWVLVDGPSIDAGALSLDAAPAPSDRPPSPIAPRVPSTLTDHREHERVQILAALESHNWNRARAAKALGMPRRTFYRRLQEHRIL